MWTQLASMLSAVIDLGADAEFRLEQHAAAECDSVGALEFVGRAVVDGDADPRPDVELTAEFCRDAGRRIAGFARGIESSENIGLERSRADPLAAPAELDVGAVLDVANCQSGDLMSWI